MLVVRSGTTERELDTDAEFALVEFTEAGITCLEAVGHGATVHVMKMIRTNAGLMA